ncbi:MAG: carbon monoxide dehydrogenase [Firmicutes bacterium]|nr:carbon monoxide dehydrogenase [Bacillota bacterium]
MNLYDDIILEIESLIQDAQILKVQPSKIPETLNNMIFQSDTAFDLGDGNMPSISLTLPSSTIQIEDSIRLIGKDLCQIQSNVPLARISIVQIQESEKKADALYNMIKRLDFTKYHVSPEGYMMRISSMLNKEPARVSKKAIQKKISFTDIGYHFIQGFHKHKEVLAVKQIFITDPDFNYSRFEELSKLTRERTNLIDHMLKDLNMDCQSCHLKPICDEVEGMKEIHANNVQ